LREERYAREERERQRKLREWEIGTTEFWESWGKTFGNIPFIGSFIKNLIFSTFIEDGCCLVL